MLDGALYGFERILRSALDLGDVAPDGIDARRGRCAKGVALCGANVIEVNEQIGQAALDGFEMAKPRVGRVEPPHQLGNTILEVRERRVIGV